MPEFKTYDPNIFTYDLIADDDIWEYKIVEQMGVINMTSSMYMERVYNAKPYPGFDKPWLICLIAPGNDYVIYPSSFLMKSLYFLQRDFPDKAYYAFVDGTEEYVREAFDYELIPQCLLIKDGRPYYLGWDV